MAAARPDARGPLAGIRVVDLCTVGPGARAAALLADLGADVVKVGPPPTANRIVAADWAYSAGRGTRRIGMDLKDQAARDALLALVATADAFLEGFRPGVADRLGVGFAATRQVNPRIVHVSLTGYGQDGPWAQWAGHDVNYQAVGGVLALQGRGADGTPALPGATWADSAGGGFHAALSICASLVGDRAAREAVHLDVSATDGVVSAMSLLLDEHLATGVQHAPESSILTGRYACYDTYACADGRFVAVGAIEPAFWRNLCRLLGLEHLAGLQRDDEQQDRVRAEVAAAFATRDRDDWVKLLGPEDTCVSPVLEPHEVVANEHLAARGTVTDLDLAGKPTRQVARVLAGAVRPDGPERAVPVAASDARDLLAQAGLDADAITDLIDREVVR